MSFYSRMLATATRLVEKYGQAATIITQTKTGTYNPTLSETETDCTYLDVGIEGTASYPIRLVDRSMVQVGDKVGIIAATATPSLTALLKLGGVRYRFIGIEPINPGGTILLYEVIARK